MNFRLIVLSFAIIGSLPAFAAPKEKGKHEQAKVEAQAKEKEKKKDGELEKQLEALSEDFRTQGLPYLEIDALIRSISDLPSGHQMNVLVRGLNRLIAGSRRDVAKIRVESRERNDSIESHELQKIKYYNGLLNFALTRRILSHELCDVIFTDEEILSRAPFRSSDGLKGTKMTRKNISKLEPTAAAYDQQLCGPGELAITKKLEQIGLGTELGFRVFRNTVLLTENINHEVKAVRDQEEVRTSFRTRKALPAQPLSRPYIGSTEVGAAE